jgi:hypothetical protein
MAGLSFKALSAEPLTSQDRSQCWHGLPGKGINPRVTAPQANAIKKEPKAAHQGYAW